MDAVTDVVVRLDPDGTKFGHALRETYDQLYDGQRTGRYSPRQLMKTESAHMGTLVEIALQRAFQFADGQSMDYSIAGVDVDCKFSKRLGGWMIPREAYTAGHLCLLVWASDEDSRWEAGLVRTRDDTEVLGAPNQDRKRSLTPYGESRIRWLYKTPALPENLLLHIDETTRARILQATPPRRKHPTGQARVNMMFRLVQRRIINRASVLTIGRQLDAMKRVRDARKALRGEGILILGHQDGEDKTAANLGLPVPTKGSFVSARVVPAEARFSGDRAEVAGQQWRLAQPNDPVEVAPEMPKPSRRSDDM